MSGFTYLWRGEFTNDEMNALHADAFDHGVFEDDWRHLVASHSLGWVTARQDGSLVGFVNVIWDGLVHAWLQDTIVASNTRHRGVGRQLVKTAELSAREAGCEWLHVDFDEPLRDFYLGACGFTPTHAGLIHLIEPTG